MLQNCYSFPRYEWETRMNSYLINQDVTLPTPEKIQGRDSQYPVCEVFYIIHI